MRSERDITAEIEKHVERLLHIGASAEYWYGKTIDKISGKQQVEEFEISERHRRAVELAKTTYDSAYQHVNTELQTIRQQAGFAGARWDSPLWKSWKVNTDGGVPTVTRFGQLSTKSPLHKLVLPALLPLISGRSVIFKATGHGEVLATAAIQSILLRLFATLPAGKVRCTFIDPVSLGNNTSAFMHLADYDDLLISGGRAWTEPHHIEQRLADLTEHMENVIQKYLRNLYHSIEDYNEQAGEVAEPYRILVVLDFPANFSEAAARRLVSIAQNGPRCGIYTLIAMDTQQSLPYGLNIADLERTSTNIVWQTERFVWEDNDFRQCRLDLDTPPETPLFNWILEEVGKAAKAAGNVEVPFERIAPSGDKLWSGHTNSGISVPIGPAGARRSQHLELGKGTAQHVIVAGTTGSGKSTLLHTLITNAALLYSPDELQFYLIDFKKGVEFKSYATHDLPHARVIAIESEREFGLSVLQGLDVELKRRGELFRAVGVDGLADYRVKSRQSLPRILLLIDEFQEFFIDDDTLASQASQILDRLVRQGRAFGIHVILGSQTLAGAYTLTRGTIDQMGVRIALRCSEADSRLILADDNPAARLLTRPGEAIYNAANGLVEGNSPFQVAWLPDEKRDQYLEGLHLLARQHSTFSKVQTIVFEGNAPADIHQNRVLQQLITTSMHPTSSRALFAWLGDPIAIQDPVAVSLSRQSGHNVLVVGQDAEAALGMMTTSLISLASQTKVVSSQGSQILCSQFNILDFSSGDAAQGDVLQQVADTLPHSTIVGRRRELLGIINTVSLELQRRLENDDTFAPPIFLFVSGLQRARDLGQDEDQGFMLDDEPQPPSPSKQLAMLLQEGPDLGIHTFVWCDTFTNLNRRLDRRSLREFALRVVFQMSAEDSSNLIDTPVASQLGQHRALFVNEEDNQMVKFRPYAVPDTAWLNWAGRHLRSRM